jgi:hypothetical protein
MYEECASVSYIGILRVTFLRSMFLMDPQPGRWFDLQHFNIWRHQKPQIYILPININNN